jgi:enoyl-[acyl-carrier protein] reductase II
MSQSYTVYINKYLRSRKMSRVTELLGSRHPIMQGAMGVICNPELVAAVSNAGGFGLLATAFATDPEAVRSQIGTTRELTDNPFGVNLQVMNPLTQEFVRVLADEGIRVVTVSGGSPKALIPVLHDLGIRVIVVVATAEVARKAEAIGADALVAEGSESGGIQGFKGVSTMVLVPAVVDTVRIPVIAAGGIADSRGYRAALALGAEGVQVGTRFIATRECIAHDNYKNLIVNSSDTGTGLINMGRIQVRALLTPLVERVIAGELVDPGKFNGEAMVKSWVEGDIEASSLPAGEVAGVIQGISTVQEIIDEMVG